MRLLFADSTPFVLTLALSSCIVVLAGFSGTAAPPTTQPQSKKKAPYAAPLDVSHLTDETREELRRDEDRPNALANGAEPRPVTNAADENGLIPWEHPTRLAGALGLPSSVKALYSSLGAYEGKQLTKSEAKRLLEQHLSSTEPGVWLSECWKLGEANTRVAAAIVSKDRKSLTRWEQRYGEYFERFGPQSGRKTRFIGLIYPYDYVSGPDYWQLRVFVRFHLGERLATPLDLKLLRREHGNLEVTRGLAQSGFGTTSKSHTLKVPLTEGGTLAVSLISSSSDGCELVAGDVTHDVQYLIAAE